MATPAAILSLLVKTEGAQAAAAQIRAVDSAGKSASSNLSGLEKSTKRASRTFSLLGTAAKGAGVLLGGVGLAKALGAMNDEYREAQKVGAQTTAVLKSTGNAAKVSQKHIENLAGAISKKAGIDDEAIQSGENLLLTFTNIRNEVGKGNQIFDRSTQVITDMSVALGQDMKSSAIQVGKALNDPVKGITALRRVGVSFTQQQQDQIKKLAESGHTLTAQKMILKELTKEFGGSAAAQATAGDKLKVSLGNLAEAAGGILVPQLDKAAVFLSRMIDEFIRGEGIAKVILPVFFQFRDAIGGIVTDLIPMVEVVAPKLVAFFASLPGPVKTAAAALAAFGLIFMATGPLGAGIAVFATAAVLIKRNWSTIGPVLQSVADVATTAFGAIVTAINAVKGAFNATVQWVQTAMNNVVTEIHKWDVAVAVVKAALVAIKIALAPAMLAITTIVRGAMAEVPVIFRTAWNIAKAVFSGAFTAIKAIVTGGLQAIHGVIEIIGGIFKGDFGQIWEGIKDIFRGQLKIVLGIVKGEVEAFTGAAKALGKGIIDGVVAGIESGLDSITGAANWLKDKIVGAVKSVFGIKSPSKVMAELGLQLVKGLLHGFGGVDIVGFVKDQVGNLASSVGGLAGKVGGAIGGLFGGGGKKGKVSGGGLDAWLTQALNITGAFSPANLAALRGRAMQESGGNPRAINLWDSNAKAGHPSKGLLQTIDSTFNAYKLPGHGDIWNPVDNAIAAIRYMFARYGHIVAANGRGYASGTSSAARGLALVGEKGPELVQFKGGEKVHSNSASKDIAAQMLWLQQTWSQFAPLLGQSAGSNIASFFSKVLMNRNLSFVGVAWDPKNMGAAPELLWPRWIWQDTPGQKALPENLRKQLLIHEMAHRFQNRKQTDAEWKAEGGAEAFARRVMDQLFGGRVVEKGDPYSAYARRVEKQLGSQWIMSGQFGYASGTGGAARGLAWVGERGPELVNFKGGETVLNHHDSMRAAASFAGMLGGYAKGTASKIRRGPQYLPPIKGSRPGTVVSHGTPTNTIARQRAALALQAWMDSHRAPPKGLPPSAAGDSGGGSGGDPNQPLIDSNNAAADAAKALADQLAAVKDEIKRQTDFANSVTATSNYQLTKSLADLIGGQIVGYGVAGRAFTPGTGSEYRY